MSDPSYQRKVYIRQGGDEMVVASGGRIVVEPGGAIDGTITVQEFGARGDGITDDVAAFRAADAAAAAAGKALYIPAGTYLLATSFSGSSEPYTPVRASWRGDGINRTIINVTHSSSHRTFRTYALGTKVRAQPLNTVSPYKPLWSIADVPAGQGWVAFTTSAELTAAVEAGTLAVGMLVHLAAGKNEQDADDPQLWFYDQLHRVAKIDTGSNRVYIEDAVDRRLTSGGWDGSGAGKNLAATYANSTIYTAGTYVWDETATSTLYKCTVGGTSNAATRAADTGCTWAAVTTALGALKTGTVDHRPILQVAEDPISDIRWSDLTLSYSGGNFAWDVRSCYNVRFERVRIHDAYVYVCEAARYVSFHDCEIDRVIGSSGSGKEAISIYQARKVSMHRCKLTGNGLGSPSSGNNTVRMESHGELDLIDCIVSCNDQTASQGYACFIDRGEINIRGGQYLGWLYPMRSGSVTKLIDEDRWIHYDSADALFQTQSGNFRDNLADIEPRYLNETNRYLVRDPYSSGDFVQRDYYRFPRSRRVTITQTFTPGNNQVNTLVSLDANVAANVGIANLDAVDMVFLGATVYWASPGDANLDIRFLSVLVGDTDERNLFSTTGNSNRIIVTSAAPTASAWKGDGTTRRLLQSGIDRLRMRYYTNAGSGTTGGGTAYVSFHMLVANPAS